MKKRISILTIALLTLASLMLSSCGKKSEAATDGKEVVELTYWSMWNETESQAIVLKSAIKEYMKQNPHVKVTVQWNGREIRKTLQPALDAGTKIDMWDEDAERVVKTWGEYAAPLDAYYDKAYPTTAGKPYKETVMASLVGLLESFTSDDSLLAIPYQPMVVSVMYNKDHFDKAGISNPPKTWNEFLDACTKLKAAGFIPLTIDDAYIDLPLGYHLDRLYGGYDEVESLVKEGGARWDDTEFLQAAKDFENLASMGYISPQVISNKWPAGQQEVATGQVSMYFMNGTWLPNEVMGTAGEEFRWGQFAYPAVNNGKDGTNGGVYGSQAFQISKDCKNPEEAFALAVHLTTGKWDQELSKKTYGAPMDLSAQWPVQIEDSQEVFAQLDKWYPWSGGLAADTDAFPIIKKEFTSLLGGQITGEEFVANIKKELP